MSRTKKEVALSSASNADDLSATTKNKSEVTGSGEAGAWIARGAFVFSVAALALAWQPFGWSRAVAAAAGFSSALVLVLVEVRVRGVAINRLAGGAAGLVLGVFTALLVCLVVARTAEPEPTKSFLEYGSLLGFAYLGVFLGAHKGRELRFDRFLQPLVCEVDRRPRKTGKLLDTSVLIDGRIADICEAHFLEGPLQVPQFVLHELQQIADSSDTLRRQRGRRGLEVLQKIQKMPHLETVVLETPDSEDGDVDRKLVELARKTGAKIITNDFNLNKVASVQGISVLNVNQLANALRPAVLPGESMRVFILREGKEANQGVAYLEDGTMVVVDGARRHMNRNIEIVVTSVHQTPAGKMIFGRLMEERNEASAPLARHAAAGRAENGGRTTDSLSRERDAKREIPDPNKEFD
jgi:uncharacterized protein YacL